MKTLASLLLGFSLLSTSACALDTGDDALSVDTSELSTSDWSAPSAVGPDGQGAWNSGDIATLNGVTFMVHSGASSGAATDLWWTKKVNNQWTTDTKIVGQTSTRRAALVAFNNTLFMFHGGNSHPDEVWVSRFNTGTQTWGTNFKLGFASRGAPALASFGGVLRIIGVNPATNQMFMSTMNTSEVFSAPVTLSQSSSSPASAAVFNNRLFVTHRSGTTDNLVINSFDGSTWSGDVGLGIHGAEASLASFGGFLHLVHVTTASSRIMWSYFDGAAWSLEVSIGTQFSTQPPRISNIGSFLEMLSTSDLIIDNDDDQRPLKSSLFFVHPPILP